MGRGDDPVRTIPQLPNDGAQVLDGRADASVNREAGGRLGGRCLLQAEKPQSRTQCARPRATTPVDVGVPAAGSCLVVD